MVEARCRLGELKGRVAGAPDEDILARAFALQEARHSSEIENVIATRDELYRTGLFGGRGADPAAGEVRRYAASLMRGCGRVGSDGLITVDRIIDVQRELMRSDAGIRRLPGTVLKNALTGETVHTPPQDHQQVARLLDNLEKFINDDGMCGADPLIKMAVIHHQFETIHPFYDGNGRTGRILNILCLVAGGLLSAPVLPLSRYIARSRSEYYRLLRSTRGSGDWTPWIMYMLRGVEETADQSIRAVARIRDAMRECGRRVRCRLPKIHSRDLVDCLFSHPYAANRQVREALGVSRITAGKRLNLLAREGIVEKRGIGRNVYYVNRPLVDVFRDASERFGG